MKLITGLTLLTLLFPLAGCATGKLGFKRCELDTFGEVHCEFTATLEAGRDAAATPSLAMTMGAIRRLNACAKPEASKVGTRAYRRCRTGQVAALHPEVQLR